MNRDYFGYFLAIISIIYAYYLQRKSIRIKEPIFSIKSNNLISGTVSILENLTISFKDHKIQNLTISKILFFNRGAETITRQDIETINRLSISSETCKILDGSILQVNNQSNNIKVLYDPANKNVFIDFEYLDKIKGQLSKLFILAHLPMI